MSFKDKIVLIEDAEKRCQELKASGLQIVFTNGCFDLLHVGHITYLEKAKALGDFLVVGLNSDASVSKLKGAGRPIKKIESRAAVLAGLESVDMVIVFEEDTPIQLITRLGPHVLVKGGDYKLDEIVGADFVLKNNGEVRTIKFVQGYSSTKIIDNM